MGELWAASERFKPWSPSCGLGTPNWCSSSAVPLPSGAGEAVALESLLERAATGRTGLDQV